MEEVAGEPEPRLALELVAERPVVAVAAHDQPARSCRRGHQRREPAVVDLGRETRWHRLRPAGSPEATLSGRPCLELAAASARLSANQPLVRPWWPKAWRPHGQRFDTPWHLFHVGHAPPPRVLLLGPIPRSLRRGSIRRRRHRLSIRRAALLVGHPQDRVRTLSLVQAATARDQPREAARTAQQPTVDAVLVNITSAETRAFGRRLGRLHRRARGLGDANRGRHAAQLGADAPTPACAGQRYASSHQLRKLRKARQQGA